jgi:DNA-binding GntR family transcriptional regulator
MTLCGEASGVIAATTHTHTARYARCVTSGRLGEVHRTLREVVADEIREMIRRGDLQPGERLLEDRLAEQLGVSRNPIREAIRILENTGLVEVTPRRGAYVSYLDPAGAAELLEVRSVLEAYAAQLAARRRSPEQLQKIRDVFEEGKAATAANDAVHAARCHREFHIAIEDAAGNSYLGPTVEPLRAQTELVFTVLIENRGILGWEEHAALLEAIEAGDEDAARDATRHHMDSVLNDLKRRSNEQRDGTGGKTATR